MMRRWNIRSFDIPGGGNDAVGEEGAIPPIIGHLLALRGIVTPQDRDRFLAPDYDRDLHDPFLFSAMPYVMDRLARAKTSGERVGVFGDFDADGITSSVLLREGLSKLELPVSVYIPDKHSEGHGLNAQAVDFFEREGVTLLFTVDCGMMNHAEIALAKERGIDVIIIDHHHVPEVLPEAAAIINPKLPAETYPFRELCGAGTTFKVLQALYSTFFPDEKGQLKWMLDVAALGTVADVMPLVGENRVIVSYGLVVLSKTRRTGFQEMFALGRVPIREGKTPIARDIAFHIAPRINAASRMAHARIAHDLLVERDAERARELALLLESHNTDRRKVSDEISTLVREIALAAMDRKLVFAVDERFHFGVIGLVAGRIANEFRKPVIVLTKGERESRGSLRSIPEVNIVEALEQCADILVRYGGHAQAAGLTVENKHLPELERRLEEIIATELSGRDTSPELVADMKISGADLSLDLARYLRKLAPFGEGNPEPVFFMEHMKIAEIRTVGSDAKHIKLRLIAPTGTPFDAIGFSLAGTIPDLRKGDVIDILCQLDENEWNGSVTLQLKLLDIRKSQGGS